MADTYDEQGNLIDDEENAEGPGDNATIKALRQQAREATKNAKRATDAERKLAFLQAGIDLESPHGQLLAKGYDGDNTVEAIKAAAEQFGIQVAGAGTGGLSPEEQAALNRVNDANQGSGSAGGTEADEYLARVKKVPPVVRLANGGWELNNIEGPEQIMQVLRDAGVGISNDQPGDFLFGDSAEAGATPRSF